MELEDNLKFFAEDQELQILQGEKVIAVKSNLINKGKAAEFWLEEDNYDFVMALGDDFTDEYNFRALLDVVVTIHVGNKMSVAKYSDTTSQEVRKLLLSLSRLKTVIGSA